MTDEDNEIPWWKEAVGEFLMLVDKDTDEQFEETVGKSADAAQDVDYRLGLLINGGSAVVFGLISWFTGGLLSMVFAVLAIISVLGIVKWVIGL